jgi:selenide,water dikinase
MKSTSSLRLTQYSHGAGCGCKIAPGILAEMLSTHTAAPDDDRLLVGNSARDDAAVYDLGDGRALISTTDFFMPIVDNPHTFGRIAAANAISDVYAMGGTPSVAIAILGWPVDTLPAASAGEVIGGGRAQCAEAGIALAGGHSIDSPEPIFGLAVTGLVNRRHLKRNDTAQAGDVLFLTKPLGVGILSTAEKKGVLRLSDQDRAATSMMQLNRIGETLGRLDGVHAMTDVTGFGLIGHLLEMCEGSDLRAIVDGETIPLLTDLAPYFEAGAVPGGTYRNWDSYGNHVGPLTDTQRLIFCDPQTSGGLLVAVAPEAVPDVQFNLREAGLAACTPPIGQLEAPTADAPRITIR